MLKPEKTNGNGSPLTAKDYATSQDVRWCPGCGDYSILKQVHTVFAALNVQRENTVFISGIGCSSRYPYYMNTYGIHGIHGRAAAIASGLKTARPDLDVWVVTGDGDSLAIGGNHFIHLLRRNVDITVLLFNNEIYGLTKGQYSPTSPKGKISKSTPFGSVDHPFNPLALALGAEGTFVSRTVDRNPIHLREVLEESRKHKGTSFVEIYQNCNVFNDKAFDMFTNKETKDDTALYLKEGEPLLFGENLTKGIRLDGFTPEIVSLDNGYSADDCWIHDPHDKIKASILTNFFDYGLDYGGLPRPFGVFYKTERYTYEDLMSEQIEHSRAKKSADLDTLLSGGDNYWVVK